MSNFLFPSSQKDLVMNSGSDLKINKEKRSDCRAKHLSCSLPISLNPEFSGTLLELARNHSENSDTAAYPSSSQIKLAEVPCSIHTSAAAPSEKLMTKLHPCSADRL